MTNNYTLSASWRRGTYNVVKNRRATPYVIRKLPNGKWRAEHEAGACQWPACSTRRDALDEVVRCVER